MNAPLILGTALWGWSVPKETAFALLDRFYAAGFRTVDTATNYPINRDPASFRAAESMLFDWVNSRKPAALKIIVKIGSLSNDGCGENNLSPEFIRNSGEYYREKFGNALDSIWLHWDNREDPLLIEESLEALAKASGGDPGVSGIRAPLVYSNVAKKMACRLRVQVKHNLFTSDLPKYEPLRNLARFYFYGINAGGVSGDGNYSVSSSVALRGIAHGGFASRVEALLNVVATSENTGFKLNNLYELSLLYAVCHAHVSGIIIGPSKDEQLAATLAFYAKLTAAGSREVYRRVIALQK